jgi:bifunctional non-homologous end joining protein LigD
MPRAYSQMGRRRYIAEMATRRQPRAKPHKKTDAKKKTAAPRRKRLPEYEAKRDFSITPEPAPGEIAPHPVPTFMIHKHHASRLHYDLRLEMDDALASWAVPKGPSYDPDVKRLAVQTEDHPLEYGSFEGRIPDGEYGAGDSLIWDRGVYETIPPGQASQQRKKGHLHLVFDGEKLKGGWHLVRTRGPSGTKSNWILFKARDELADKGKDIVADAPESVVSGRAATRGPERAGQLSAPRRSPEKLLEAVWPPMLATLVAGAPEPASDWVAELKYDGYRAVCALSNGRVQMVTRNALDLNARFPHIARALSKVVVGDAVIDGEIVSVDADGVPHFQLLQDGSEDTILYAFDLLWLDGQDLRARPLDERRDLLMSLLSRVPVVIKISERVPGDFQTALQDASSCGWEGLVLKRRGSPYVGTRSKDWIKLKAQKSQELAIVGFTPSSANPKMIGALLVGVVEDGTLRFAGKVGTGFSNALRGELMRDLKKDALDKPTIAGAPRMRDATWVTPRLVAQVEFTEWTSDGKLRHPSFVGLREDKSPMECTLEQPKAPPHAKQKTKTQTKAKTQPETVTKTTREKAAPRSREKIVNVDDGNGPRVELTNPTRLIYPRDQYTKEDVAAYFAAVAQPMLRALADRPLALQHWPKGIDGPTWFHQNIGSDAPSWLRRVDTPTRTRGDSVAHLVVDRPEALRFLAQRSALTVHMWSSRAPHFDQPDWVIFDLDPAEGETIEQAISVAHALHSLLEELSLPSVPKTTGKRGLHVLVPLLPGHTHEDAIEFAEKIGGAIVSALPQATMERSLSKRKGRLYVDCYQNGYGKTIVAPYSPRAIDGAPVSAPLKWSEVVAGLDPRQFNFATMPARLQKVGDLFLPALEAGVRLPRLR